jgi:hypothetical protein
VPLQPLEAFRPPPLEVVVGDSKRPRDSPEKPNVVDLKPAPKKQQPELPLPAEKPLVLPLVVEQAAKPIVVPVPPVPCLPSSFDLLAAELSQIVISTASESVSPRHNSAPAKTESDSEAEEKRITAMRTKYVALKCVRAWRMVAEEAGRWKWLAGSSRRAPARINK